MTAADPGCAADRASLRDLVRVWYVQLDGVTPAALDDCAAVLSSPERARVARYRVESAHREFVVGKALLRRMLASHTGVSPEAWAFGASANGKPFVHEPREHAALSFSISHTRGLVACALALDRAVGVDVESLDHVRVDVGALAVRYFSAIENASIGALAGEERRRRFFELWTLKESYLKARDLHLTSVLRHASFTLTEGTVTAAFDATLDDDPGVWSFALHAPSDRHVAALTAGRRAGEPARVEWREVPVEAQARTS
jgi:4'-phosphopantetheinyl transferase